MQDKKNKQYGKVVDLRGFYEKKERKLAQYETLSRRTEDSQFLASKKKSRLLKIIQSKLTIAMYKKSIAGLVLLSISIGGVLLNGRWNNNVSSASTFNYVQTDWNGGIDGTSVATHGTNQTGWNKYQSGTNVDHSTAGEIKIQNQNLNASESFASTTNKDSANTTATWDTSGQLSVPASTATNLQSKIFQAWGSNEVIQSSTIDGNGNIYIGTSLGKFVKYDASTNIATELTSSISSFWSTNVINALAYNSTSNEIYIGGTSGKFAKYVVSSGTATELTSSISNFWSTNAINAISYNGTSNEIYMGGGNGKFAKYVVSSGTATNLGSTISSFWGGNDITALAYNSTDNEIYLGGGYGSGKFVKYGVNSGTATNLTSSISSFLGGSAVGALLYTSTSNEIYIGSGSGKFIKYIVSSGIVTSLGSAISSFWGGNDITALAYNSTSNEIYMGSSLGKFAKYGVSSGTATDLTSTVASFWSINSMNTIISTSNTIYSSGVGRFSKYLTTTNTSTNLTTVLPNLQSTYPINAMMFAGNSNEIYIGGDRGKSAKYSISDDTIIDLTTTLSNFWSSGRNITSMVYDSSTNEIYLSGTNGIFGKYSLSTNAATDLSNKLSSFWSGNSVSKLAYSSASNEIYALGGGGKFGKYSVNTNIGTDLTSSISSFWGTTTNGSALTYNSTNNELYLGNNTGNLVAYSISSGSATDLTSKISSFWSTNEVGSLFWINTTNELYLVSTSNGRFAKYSIVNNTVTDLSSSVSSFLPSPYPIYSLEYNSVSKELYFGGYNGSFGKYSIITGTGSILNSKISSYWGPNDLKSFLYNSATNDMYIGGTNGNFTKFFDPYIVNAQSTTLDTHSGGIGKVTLTKTDTVGTGTITYNVSNNGGANFFQVTPGTQYTFTDSSGSDLRFKVSLTGNATVQDVSLAYSGYSDTASLISTPFYTTDPATVVSKIQWSEILPTGTDLKFQMRTSPDNVTYTSFCGPDNGGNGCDTTTYFTDPNGGELVDSMFKDGVQDQYIQYKAYLSTSQGNATPVLADLTLQYVINATPTVSSVSASQNSSGIVNVTYNVNDPEETTGTASVAADVGMTLSADLNSGANSMTVNSTTSLLSTGTVQVEKEQISYTGKTSTTLTGLIRGVNGTSVPSNHASGEGVWVKATTVTGDVGSISMSGSSSSKSLSWNIKTDLNGVYYATSKIRVSVNDGNAANQVGLGDSTVFALDTKDPASPSITINSGAPKVNSRSVTLHNIGASDDSTLVMQFSNDGVTYGTQTDGNGNITDSGTYQAFTTTKNWTLLSGVDGNRTVYVKFKDSKNNSSIAGNYTIIYDTTNPGIVTGVTAVDISKIPSSYKILLSWDTVNASDFTKYSIERSTDAINFSQLTTITDKTIDNYTNTGLTPNTKYYYRIKTEDDIGNISDPSSVVNQIASGDHVAPSISGITATSSTPNSVIITWTTDENATSEVEYGTSQSYDNGKYSVADKTLLTTNHSLTISNLIPSTLYHFRAISKDKGGNESQSADNTITTMSVPTVSGLTISSLTTRTAVVSWNTNSNTSSELEFGTTTSYGQKRGSTAQEAVHSVSLTDLQPNTTYYYKISSTDSSGNAVITTGTTFTTLDVSSISNLSVLAITTKQAQITWVTSGSTTGEVEFGTTTSYGQKQGGANSGTNHSVSLKSLLPNTLYHYRISSKDTENNTITSSDQTFTTDSIPVVSGIAVTNIQNNALTISWTTSAVTTSTIEYGTTSAYGATQGNIVQTPNHSVQLQNLQPNTSYHFRINSLDNEDNSVNSTDQIGQTTSVATITSLTVTNIKTKEVTITWTSSEETSSEIEYGITNGYGQKYGSSQLTTSHVVTLTNLEPNTSYHYRVKSLDSARNEVTTQDAIYTTNSLSSVSGLTVSSIQTTQVTIEWTTTELSTSELSYGLSSTYGKSSGSKIVTTNHTVTLNSLLPNTVYHYEINSLDSEKNTITTSDQVFTTNATSGLNTITVADLKPNRAIIQWQSSQTITSILEYGETISFGTTYGSNTLKQDHQIVLSGLQPNKQYYYRINSQDSEKNIITSATQTFTTAATSALSDVAITDISSTAATISWVSSDETTSIVEYSKNNKNSTFGEEVLIKNHKIILPNLSPSTTYTYRIKSLDAYKNDIVSTSQTFTTMQMVDSQAPKVTDINVKGDSAAITVEWNTDEPATSQVYYGADTLNTPVNGGSASIIGFFQNSWTILKLNLVLYVKWLQTLFQILFGASLILFVGYNLYMVSVVKGDLLIKNLFIAVKSVFKNTPTTGFSKLAYTVQGSWVVPYTEYLNVYNKLRKRTIEVAVIGVINLVFLTGFPQALVLNFSKASFDSIDFKSTQEDTNLVTNHKVNLTSVEKNKLYYYYVSSKDQSQNEGGTKATPSFFLTDKINAGNGGPGGSGGNGIVGPAISAEGPIVKVISNTVLINWNTNEVSNSIVEYVQGDKIGEDFERAKIEISKSEELVKKHEVKITNLAFGIKYSYRVKSINSNREVSKSEIKTFQTENLPDIFSVEVSNIEKTKATITYESKEATIGTIEYGPTPSYGTVLANEKGLNTRHVETMSGLNSGATYHFRIRVKNKNNEEAISSDYVFKTQEEPRVEKVIVKDIQERQFTVEFSSTVEGIGSVEYTDTKGEKRSISGTTKTKTHQIEVKNIESNMEYQVVATVQDSNQNLSRSTIQKITTKKDDKKPEISQVRTESFINAKADKAQILVSWKTDKPTTSQVMYALGKIGDKSNSTEEDKNLTTDHLVVINSAKLATTYELKVNGTDSVGNKSESESYIVLTPRQRESLIQVLISNFEKTFSWTKNIRK